MLELPSRRTTPSSRLPPRITVSNRNTNTLGTKWFSNTGDILASLFLVTTLSINIILPNKKNLLLIDARCIDFYIGG